MRWTPVFFLRQGKIETMPTGSSRYCDVEPRFSRWLKKYQGDRAAHSRARREHPDPMTLDAEFAQAMSKMSIDRCHTKLAELRAATSMLLKGARASTEHFQDNESFSNRGDIVDLLEWYARGRAFIIPEVASFFEALLASGSRAVLENRRYVGNGGLELPYFVLQSVLVGGPWGAFRLPSGRLYPSEEAKTSFREDQAFRRTCLRLLARMAFFSAERAVARGETHPFMVLLQTDRGGQMNPLYEIGLQSLVDNPTNQSAALQVLYLMKFVCRGFPWARGQHLADAEHAHRVMAPGHWIGEGLSMKMARMVLLVPGFVRELVVDQTLWHVLAAYGLEGHICAPQCFRCVREDQLVATGSQPYSAGERFTDNCRHAAEVARLWNGIFNSGKEENSLIRTLRQNRFVSTWVCGKGRRPLLLKICRQRRRRVIQVRASTSSVRTTGRVSFL